MSRVQGRCLVCNVEATLVCSRCKAVHYCCKDHQTRHWRQHKKDCVPAVERVEEHQLDDEPFGVCERSPPSVDELIGWLKTGSESGIERALSYLLHLQSSMSEGNDCVAPMISGANTGRLFLETFERKSGPSAIIEVAMNRRESYGCMAIEVLRGFPVLESRGRLKRLSDLLVKKQAIRAVVRVMETEPDNFVLQGTGHFCFLNWLSNAKMHTLIFDEAIDAGVLHMAVAFFTRTSGTLFEAEHEQIDDYNRRYLTPIEFTLEVLYYLAGGSFAHKTAVVRAGALSAVAVVAEKAWRSGTKEHAKLLLSCKDFYEAILCRCDTCMESKRCACCGKKTKLSCNGCGRARYCSTKCQKRDRKRHKKYCKFLPNDEIIDCACQQELRIANDRETYPRLTDVESLSAAISTLQTSLTSLSTGEICDLLHVIAMGDKSTCFGADIVVKSVIQVMQEKIDVPEIQKMACVVFLCAHSLVPFAVPAPFVSEAVLESVLATLDLYEDDPSVVGCACNCMVILAAHVAAHEDCDVPRMIDLITRSMNRFPDDFGVQIGGCGTLWNLSCIGLEDAVVEAGGIRLLANAGERLWDTHEEVDERVSKGLQAILKKVGDRGIGDGAEPGTQDVLVREVGTEMRTVFKGVEDLDIGDEAETTG